MNIKLLSAIPLLAVAACQPSGKVVDKPAVMEFFIMSQCPYGIQVVNGIAPTVEQLGPNLELKVEFIGDKSPDGTLTSMHGPAEVQGNLIEICAQKHDAQKFVKLMVCMNKNPRDVAGGFEPCAKELAANAAAIKTCAEGDEGKALLAASYEVAKQKGASGSPTMFLNGKPYEGGRKAADFTRAICNEFTGNKPQACSAIPVAPKVEAIFLSDQRCPECNIAPLEGRLKSELGGLTVKNVDYSSEEGKKLFADLTAKDPSFKLLPAVLFDASIEKDAEGYAALKRWLRPVAGYQALAVGAKFDPTAEICDNKVDDDADGKVDCAQESCSAQIVCRAEEQKSLDLFVMSQCPYGAKAVLAMKEVLANFGNDLALNVEFIGDAQGLSSMHGSAEVEEDIRQACAIKAYGKGHKYMEYLTCRAEDYKSANWEACTGKNGIDAAVIKKCYDGEGKELLRKSFQLADSLGIDGSPTFLANNKHTFGGIDPEGIKGNYCKHNPGLKGCANTLSSGGAQVQGSCGN